MKTLYLLRHAKSSWKDTQLPDHDRPLNSRGKRDAPRMGKLMESLSMNPDLILSSTAVRARKTAELVSKASHVECPVELREELYHASVIDYYDILHTLYYDEKALMIIGHNPGIGALAQSLAERAGNDADMPDGFPTSAAVVFQTDNVLDKISLEHVFLPES